MNDTRIYLGITLTTHEPLPPAQTLVLKPLRGLGTAASIMVALTCVASLADAWSDWSRHQLVRDYLAGRGATDADLYAADDLSFTIGMLLLVVTLAAGVVFLVWLWQARLNGERIAWDAHRLSRGWTIGGWFCPIVNFWYPFRIVTDIWQASRPEGVPSAARPVRWWWAAWVGTWVASLWLRFESRGEISLDQLQDVAVANTVATVLQCASGVLVIMVVRQITAWQATPRRATESTRRA